MKRNLASKPLAALPDIHYPHAAGVDIGAREIFVAVPEDRDAMQSIRGFATFTHDLEQLAEWLTQCRITHVAMEATGVFWIPLFELLERRGFQVFLVDPHQTKQVAGRKSDVSDSRWIQRLMSWGLLHAAFRPADPICQLRSLVRDRAVLVREQTTAVNRVHKALTQMNIQLGHVVSDLTGVTALAIVRAIVAGERSATVLAKLRSTRLRVSDADLLKSLCGTWHTVQLFELRLALSAYDFFAGQINETQTLIDAHLMALKPTGNAVSIETQKRTAKTKRRTAQQTQSLCSKIHALLGVDLTSIPCIGVDTALIIATEIGPNLSLFPTSAHFCSYVGLAPRPRISGGKRISGGETKRRICRVGQALKQAATAARRNETFIGCAHRARLRRMEKGKAIKATAHHLASPSRRARRGKIIKPWAFVAS